MGSKADNVRGPGRGRRRHGRVRGGFTLIEAALTTVIIGTGVLAILAAQQAYHRKNNWAARTGTAVLLANEIREMMLSLPMHDPITGATTLGVEAGETGVADFDDLDDFAGTIVSGYGEGTTFSPPINALRQTVPDMEQWSQQVFVENVLPENISVSEGLTVPLGSTDMMRIRVVVRFNGTEEQEGMAVTELTWVTGR